MPTEVTALERQALEALYERTDGDNWRARDGWLSPSPSCTWHGVTCGGGHITGLSLPDNALAGHLPPLLSHLAYLTHLDLSGNQLHGTLPHNLGHIRRLHHLNLASNQLRGPIPSRLRLLLDLEVLDLHDNFLSGGVVPALGDLVRLRALDLSENRLSGEVPPELGRLTRLTQLRLSRNAGLRGPLPISLTALTALEVFAFANTHLWPPVDPAFEAWLTSIPTVARSGVAPEELERAREGGHPRGGWGILAGAGAVATLLGLVVQPLVGLVPSIAVALGLTGTGAVLGRVRQRALGRSAARPALPDLRHQATVKQIRETLQYLRVDAAGRLPAELLEGVDRVAEGVLAALPYVGNIHGGARDIYILRQTALEYLPQALEYYCALPPDDARTYPLRDGKPAYRLFQEQLDLLEGEIASIAARLRRDQGRRLSVHGRFLENALDAADQEPLDADHELDTNPWFDTNS